MTSNLYAADLHLHSRFSRAVSPRMTLETIAAQAQRKGIDVIATGDALHAAWRAELRAGLTEAEPGWYALRPEVARRVEADVPPNLRRPVRFVVSTEVSCAGARAAERLRGLHHLIYFPSLESADAFARKIAAFGDLTEGRPTLSLDSRELLARVRDHHPRGHFAPAHVMNPYYSCFGVIEGHARLEEIFGDLAPELLAAETGLTSIPPMCRRLSCLDGLALFSNSDAHSPETIGRECTLVEAAPGYDALFTALGGAGGVRATLKVPLEHTRYYRNRCARCARSFAATRCPRCNGRLTTGSHDRLEEIADRPADAAPRRDPPHRMLEPLKPLLARLAGARPENPRIVSLYERMLREIGCERFILTRADADVLASIATPPVARAILAQRRADHRFSPPEDDTPRERPPEQAELWM